MCIHTSPMVRTDQRSRQPGSRIPFGGIHLELGQKQACRKIGAADIRIAEICTDQVRTAQISTAEIGSDQVGTAQADTTQIGFFNRAPIRSAPRP